MTTLYRYAFLLSLLLASSFSFTLLDRRTTFISLLSSTLSFTKQGPEMTNSITASRHTNISPMEAYDIIRQRIPSTKDGIALDLGAGAGVSTELLYNLGYTTIDAVDWNTLAWNDNVVDAPSTVHFVEQDDSRYLQSCDRKYDAIVYNFAVNPAKALKVAQGYLNENGVLLAPVNEKPDYWYKQVYVVLNSKGQVLWQSADSVGAWSVQFQPDVTSPTCTGIWCGSFNGYLK